MSIRGGPDIIEDGLVLHLDAAETAGYLDEPTTNVVTSPFSVTSGFARSGGSVTENVVMNFDGNQTASLVSGFNWLAKISGYSSIVTGGTYTTTWILKKYNQYTARMDWGGSHTGNKPVNVLNFDNGTVSNGNIEYLGDGWFRCWYTSTLNSGTASYYPQLTPTAVGAGYYFGGLQVERKSYATTFVNGSRTGPTIIDLTNNRNNGTITRGVAPTSPFRDSNNGGSFVFDGSNDYIETNYTPGNISTQTISCWINKSNLQYSYILAKSTLYYGFEIYPTIIYVNIGANKYGRVTYNTNGWQNIVFTYDGNQADNSSRLKIYFNGDVQTVTFTGIIPSSINVSDVIQIGRRWWTANNNLSQGSMGQVSIYNKALSANEVRQNYNATKGRFGL